MGLGRCFFRTLSLRLLPRPLIAYSRVPQPSCRSTEASSQAFCGPVAVAVCSPPSARAFSAKPTPRAPPLLPSHSAQKHGAPVSNHPPRRPTTPPHGRTNSSWVLLPAWRQLGTGTGEGVAGGDPDGVWGLGGLYGRGRGKDLPAKVVGLFTHHTDKHSRTRPAVTTCPGVPPGERESLMFDDNAQVFT